MSNQASAAAVLFVIHGLGSGPERTPSIIHKILTEHKINAPVTISRNYRSIIRNDTIPHGPIFIQVELAGEYDPNACFREIFLEIAKEISQELKTVTTVLWTPQNRVPQHVQIKPTDDAPTE